MSKKIEMGELLKLARKEGSIKKFCIEYPTLGARLDESILDRENLATSHNRMRTGPYAKGKRGSNAARNKRIVKMALEHDGNGYALYSYGEIGEEFDFTAYHIARICRAATIHCYKT